MSTLFEFLSKGGLAVYPLIALSVFSWAIIIERALALRTSSLLSSLPPDWRSYAIAGEIDKLSKILSEDNSQISLILRALLEDYKAKNLNRSELLSTAHALIDLLIPKVEKNIALLSVIASVAPLIGLFGTITGLIKVFSAFSFSSPDEALKLLSLGISEALIAAAMGLAVAIPSLIAYWLFRIQANSVLSKIESEVIQLVRLLP
ncbi:MAG: MotA/TolQ/ExbB proton channel family protein [Aquificaceae bacterium]|nr:MotA/TolQ/ExbB proton channel family protein [Aquificaceae bacterium]MDW8237643.1 MotA/TolQ/ExbB proton channel family protein [Aquificaceae bacterium]